jgi:hypothetical protein
MIRREAPEVITGARGPREARELQVAEKRSKRTLGLGRAPAGKVRYQAAFANLRLQITAPPDLRDPFTGRITVSRPKAAQFRDHFYDVEATNKEVIDILQAHPNFGKTFWLLSDVIEIAKKQQVESVKQQLQDPEFAEAVKAALTVSATAEFPTLTTTNE